MPGIEEEKILVPDAEEVPAVPVEAAPAPELPPLHVQLPAGKALEVLNPDRSIRFLARVEWAEGDRLQIINASEGDIPPVLHGDEINLRGYLPNGQTIQCQGLVCGSSLLFWRLEQVTYQILEENRTFFRQKLDVEAKVVRVSGVPERTPNPCQFLDISGGGARFRCKTTYDSGDKLRVSGVAIQPKSRPFTFNCVIRRVTAERKGYIYGVEFFGMNEREQDRLIQTIFLLQRRETQRFNR